MKRIKKKYSIILKWLSTENHKYNALGIFFLLLQFVVFLGNISADRTDVFYWFCNHTPIILSIGFFMKNFNLIKSIINVGFIAQFLWTLDFIGKLFFNRYIFEVTNYVFEDMHGIGILIPILIHMLATNLAFYFTYKKTPKLVTLLYSLIYVICIYALTLAFTLEENNINCVYEICGAANLTFTNYTYFWPIVMFLAIILPTQAIQYFAYYKYSKRNKNKQTKS